MPLLETQYKAIPDLPSIPELLKNPSLIYSLSPQAQAHLNQILRNVNTPIQMADDVSKNIRSPYRFFKEVLHQYPSSKAVALGYKDALSDGQKRVVDSVLRHQFTAVPSGRSTGKTFLASSLALWYYKTFGPSCLVFTVAPTWQIVKTVLWSQIRKQFIRAEGKIPGECLTTEIKNPQYPEWRMFGVSTDTNIADISATRLHGLHEKFVLVIIEEACDIPEEVFKAIEGSIVKKDHRVLAIANPTNISSAFYKRCQSQTWNVVPLSALETPNYIHRDEDIIDGLATYEYVERWKEEYGGEASQGFLSLMCGKWAENAEHTLIPIHDLYRCHDRWKTWMLNPGKIANDRRGLCLGIDVAREGEDRSVIAACHNGKLYPVKIFQERDTTVLAQTILQTVRELQPTAVGIDSTAVGGGPFDLLRQAREEGDIPREIMLHPFNFGSNAYNVEKYNRIKDQMWWELREDIVNDKVAIPNDDDCSSFCSMPMRDSLEKQLLRPISFLDGRGRIDIYDKREPGKEVTWGMPTKSPDIAHGLMIARMVWSLTRADKIDNTPKSAEEFITRAFRKSYDKFMAKAAERINRQQGNPAKGRRGRMIY